MSHSTIRSSVWGGSEHSELSSSSSQQLTRLPTHDLVEQSTTVVRDGAQYLIRAYIRLGSPLTLYPFEIVQIVPVGHDQQYRWRVPAGSLSLTVDWLAEWLPACEERLKNWAAAFVGAEAAAA